MLVIENYPGTGSTWVRFMMIQVLQEFGHRIHTFEYDYLMDNDIVQFWQITESINAEVAWIRNPYDTLVSNYFHLRSTNRCPDSVKDVVEFFHFSNEDEVANPYSLKRNVDLFCSYGKEQEFITYEDCMADTPSFLINLSARAGLELDRATAEKITRLASFENMQKIEDHAYLVQRLSKRFLYNAHPTNKEFRKARKQLVGDWRKYFTPTQEMEDEINRIPEHVKAHLNFG